MKRCYCPGKALAVISGNTYAPCLHGNVWLVDTGGGVRVEAKICGLPPNATGFYGFHVHETGSCSPSDFSGAKGHFNPVGLEHPLHAGDFPILIATDSMNAYLAFLTTRFSVREVIGRSVIIHESRDDYTSQPSGNAGRRIGCGIIQAV